MTAIVGVVGPKGKQVIGGDSLTSWGDTYVEVRGESKVWAAGDYLMGVAGSSRAANIARHVFVPPKPRSRDLDRFMVTTFVDALREAMTGRGYTYKEHNHEEVDMELLVLVRGAIYTVSDEFEVERARTAYAASGSGTRPALGALYATTAMGATKQRVRLALEAAAAYDSCVRGPFTIIGTGD